MATHHRRSKTHRLTVPKARLPQRQYPSPSIPTVGQPGPGSPVNQEILIRVARAMQVLADELLTLCATSDT